MAKIANQEIHRTGLRVLSSSRFKTLNGIDS